MIMENSNVTVLWLGVFFSVNRGDLDQPNENELMHDIHDRETSVLTYYVMQSETIFRNFRPVSVKTELPYITVLLED